MHQEMHPIYPLVYMPMPEIPGFVVNHLLNAVQPVLRAVINGGLVDSGEDALSRYILERAGVRKHNIHRMCPALLFDIFFDRGRRLLIRPPVIAHTQTIEFVKLLWNLDDAVC